MTMIMIAAMEVTKANSVIHNTKRVRLRNSHAKTSSVFDRSIDVMEKMVIN